MDTKSELKQIEDYVKDCGKRVVCPFFSTFDEKEKAEFEIDDPLTYEEFLKQRELVYSAFMGKLERKLKRGKISSQEVEDVRKKLFDSKDNKDSDLEVIAVDKDDPGWDEKLKSLSHFYFRQIFGSVPDEDNPKGKERYESTVLVGLVDKKPAGAVWLIDEPREDYKNCTYVDKLYVRDQYQRKTGLGSLLLFNALEEVPEGNCLILHAWDGAIDFYLKNGFLLEKHKFEELGGEFFYQMVLPLTKKSFNKYQRNCEEEIATLAELLDAEKTTPEDCKESGHHLFSGMAENLSLTEWEKYVGAIAQMKCNQHLDLNENPFTMFLYKRLGKGHTLLDSNQK